MFFLRSGLLASLLLAAAEVWADQPQPARADWTVSAGVTATSGAVSANEDLLALRRRDTWGSIAIERLAVRRAGLGDEAWAVDAYPKLWSGAYANLRLQESAAPDLYPDRVWRAELYQEVGSGWELSLSRDHLGFAPPVNIDGLTIGKYWGNFFVRLRHQQVTTGDTRGQGDRLMVRYFTRGEADDYVELMISQGRSYETSALLVSPSRSDVRGLFWQHYFTQAWGARFGLTQSRDTQSTADIRALSAMLMHRW